MKEIQEAASLIQEQAHEDANIIFGASIDESLGENVKVTVIATGFDTAERQERMEMAASSARSAYNPQNMATFAPQQSLAPQTVPSQRGRESYVPQSARPTTIEQQAASTRRPAHAHEARTQSAQSRLPLRDSSPSSFPNLESDWDVPAFQRKGGG
jgi:cell division protein FtsZ